MKLTDSPIPARGIVHDLPNAVYHSLPHLGASGLKLLRRSPFHYWASLQPTKPATAESDALALGSLTHCAILEPDRLGTRYAVKPEGMSFATKDGKAWRDANAELEIVNHDAMQAALRMASAVRTLPEVASLLAIGNPEVSAFWPSTTGVPCKCRPDWVAPAGDGVILLDIKTTEDASPAGFAKACARYGYHMQAAWYCGGYAQATGRPVLGFVFVAVESTYPHAPAAYMLDDESLEKGRAECTRLLAEFDQCRERNEWPAYPNNIQPLGLPAWA